MRGREARWCLIAIAWLAAAERAAAQDFRPCSDDDACDPGLVCVAPMAGEAELGYCDVPPPEPLACDDAGACPPPLVCDDTADPPRCAYQTLACERASDCPARFECVDAELITGGCASCLAADGGVACEPVPCAEAGVPDRCEPERIACEDDGDCPARWRCVRYVEHVLPAHWTGIAAAERGCLPEGTIAFSEGRATWTANVISTDALPNGFGPSTVGGREQADPAAGNTDTAGRAGAKASGGGCRASGGRTERGEGEWIAAVALALVLVHRRRALATRRRPR